MEGPRGPLRRPARIRSRGRACGKQNPRARQPEMARARERWRPRSGTIFARAPLPRSRSRHPRGARQSRRQIRAVLRRTQRAEGHFQKSEESHRRRPRARRRPARPDSGRRRYFGPQRSPRQHHTGENRKSHDHRWRPFQRKNKSKTRFRGWPLVRDPRRSSAGKIRREKIRGRRRRRLQAIAASRRSGPMNRKILRGAAILAAFAAVAPRTPRAQNPGTIFIQNATVLTVSHGNIEHGSILIRDGKIAAVGADLKAPEGAAIIDATGQYVMPGIIDCHSHIAVDGSVNEAGPAVSSMANIADVLNPDDIDIYRDLAGGVTTANILHGSANPIGGQTVVIKLRWGKPASELPFQGALPGIKFALGENPKHSNFPTPPGVTPRYPGTRLGVEEVIRQAFIEAREYKKQWDDYNQRKAAGEQNLIPPRRNVQLDPLVEVMEGKRYVHAHCYRADEILMLIRVANEFGFKVRTFQHVLEGYKIADEIAASGAGGSTFSDWWAYKMEASDAIPYNAALMAERGVIVSVNSDDAQEARQLNQEAAKTMKYGGLSANDALKLITLNPAIQLGIDARAGSIDVGKDADLAIYNHDPLSVYAVVQKTLIDGQVYFDRDRDLAQRSKLAAEKQSLLDKEKKAAEEKKADDKKSEENSEKKPSQKKKPSQDASGTAIDNDS